MERPADPAGRAGFRSLRDPHPGLHRAGAFQPAGGAGGKGSGVPPPGARRDPSTACRLARIPHTGQAPRRRRIRHAPVAHHAPTGPGARLGRAAGITPRVSRPCEEARGAGARRGACGARLTSIPPAAGRSPRLVTAATLARQRGAGEAGSGLWQEGGTAAGARPCACRGRGGLVPRRGSTPDPDPCEAAALRGRFLRPRSPAGGRASGPAGGAGGSQGLAGAAPAAEAGRDSGPPGRGPPPGGTQARRARLAGLRAGAASCSRVSANTVPGSLTAGHANSSRG